MKGKIDDFIDRSFRDIADEDYIAARVCARRHLDHQFYWMAQQAVEKYLKGILLYSREPVMDLGHNLSQAYAKAAVLPTINLRLTPESIQFIDLLNEQGPNRYFEWNLRLSGKELLLLDECVWALRTRCVALNSEARIGDKLIWTSGEHFKKAAEHGPKDNPANIRIPFGRLEKHLAAKSEAGRDLVWKNFWFGRRRKTMITWGGQYHHSSPTHVIHPTIFQELHRLLKFSPRVTAAFEAKGHFKKPIKQKAN